jgi:hypothetical protein
MKLKSIAAEEAACRKAWGRKSVGMAWHLHHKMLVEDLSEPASNRIDYILSGKPKCERALRLRLFRPVKARGVASARAAYSAAVASARAAYDAAVAPAHAIECPGCPWNGTTIFGGE